MIQNILRNCGYWCFIQPPKDWLEAAVADAASQHPRLGILSRKSINIKHYSMLQSTWARRTQQSYGYALSSSTHSIIKTKLLLSNLLHWKYILVNNQGHQHFSFFIFIRLTFYSIPVNKASYQLKQKNILMFILQVLVWLVSSIGWVLKRRLLWWWKLWLQL